MEGDQKTEIAGYKFEDLFGTSSDFLLARREWEESRKGGYTFFRKTEVSDDCVITTIEHSSRIVGRYRTMQYQGTKQ